MAGGTYISGLSSGIDWTSMVSQLVAVARNPVVLLENKQDALSAKKDAWDEFNSKLQSLQTAMADLSDLDDFDVFAAQTSITGTTSDVDDLLSVAVGSNAEKGSYLVQVNEIAQAGKVKSNAVADPDAELGYAGEFTLNGEAVTFTATDTLTTIKNAINATTDDSNVSASIITGSDGNSYLTLTALETGADSLTMASSSGDDILTNLGLNDAGNVVVVAQDAEVELDGVTISSSTNTISDAITGVTLSLNGADSGSSITLNIVEDTETVKSNIEEFVEAYNSVMSYITEQNTAAEEDGEENPLFGDTTLQSIKSSIRNIVLGGVDGLSSDLDHLSLVGINLDNSGQLSIDDDTLDGYLETNFDDVRNLFAAEGDGTPGTEGFSVQLEDLLEGMTDSLTGYVATKSSFLQDQIDNLGDKILDKEESLSRYEETLLAKFSAMETALSRLYSQQDWLTGQIANLSS